MSIFPRWAAMLLLLGLAHQLDPSLAASASSFASGNAWQRALFGRESRNLMHRRAPFSGAADLGLDEYLGPYGAVEQEQHQPHPPPQQVSAWVEVVIAGICRTKLQGMCTVKRDDGQCLQLGKWIRLSNEVFKGRLKSYFDCKLSKPTDRTIFKI